MGFTYVRDMEARLRNEQNTVLHEVKTALVSMTTQIAQMDGKLAQMGAKFAQMDAKFDQKFDKLDKDIFKSNTVGVFIIAILVITQPFCFTSPIYCTIYLIGIVDIFSDGVTSC